MAEGTWGDRAAEAAERKGQMLPERMLYAKRVLSAQGCTLGEGADGQSYVVHLGALKGRFWPYNGYWQFNRKSGRGISGLLAEVDGVKSADARRSSGPSLRDRHAAAHPTYRRERA